MKSNTRPFKQLARTDGLEGIPLSRGVLFDSRHGPFFNSRNRRFFKTDGGLSFLGRFEALPRADRKGDICAFPADLEGCAAARKVTDRQDSDGHNLAAVDSPPGTPEDIGICGSHNFLTTLKPISLISARKPRRTSTFRHPFPLHFGQISLKPARAGMNLAPLHFGQS